MKKIITFAAVALAFVVTGYCKAPTVTCNGISINQIGELEKSAAHSQMNCFRMTHSTFDTTKANINCLVEQMPYSTSWNEYINLSCMDIQNRYFTWPNRMIIGSTRAILDYRINIMGYSMHVHQLIIRDDDRAYIITASAMESFWNYDIGLRNELIDCVHSAQVQ